jgi:broad specificity phosphatase PhoE
MTNIYLVRHCKYENPDGIVAGRLPLELGEVGIAQAQKLKNFFTDKEITKIYSSAVRRCEMTSEIIANEFIPVEYDVRLLETMTARQGVKGGGSFEHYAYRHVLGGESYTDITKRMIDFYENTTWDDSKNYIICSHGDPLYMLYNYLLGNPPVKDYEFDQPKPSFEGYQPMGSIRVVQLDNDKAIVGELIENETVN